MSMVRLKRTLVGIALAESMLCVGLILYAITHKPLSANSVALVAPAAILHMQPTSMPKTVNAGVPVRLKIPGIGIDAAVERIGLTAQGNLGAPQDPANAGWYDQGPRPGDSGDAIIDGHFGYRNHIPAVFDDLHTLHPGDIIYTEDENGVTTTFTVRTTQTFSPNEDASIVFHPADGDEHLNLITCQGAWSSSQKSYANRLVVFADKQDTTQ